MRDSRLLIVLIIASIFAIVVSIFFFIRNKNQEPENVDDVVIEDDRGINEVSVDKDVQPYVAPSTSNVNNSDKSVSVEDNNEIISNNNEITNDSVAQKIENESNVPKSPDTPTVDNVPTKTDKDEEKVEISGEAGAEVFVNDLSVGMMGDDGNKTITLNTAGGDGDKVFSVFLKNKIGKSGILKITIKKDTSSVSTSSSTSSSSTSTTISRNVRGEWNHIYTNEEYFDIDDYKDDDILQLKLRDVCNENRNVVNYCNKTSKVDSDFDEDDLGEDKCSSSCTLNQTCLLWNNKELSDGSLRSWVVLYRCE